MSASDYTKILIRDLELHMLIGVYGHEKLEPQPVLINVALEIDAHPDRGDRLENTVSYGSVARDIREFTGSRHFDLVETVAEGIADICLLDVRVMNTTVRIEKTAVYSDIAGLGVEIRRGRR